ncbi:hypothetical protein RLOC_00014672 [Lonchura striata]|uniref:Uncharacterized protein n=1 Tax=Lonchura striata TaxID=40157 RepID=A0A218V3V4_9PASE|nr:hypothetical protein RLOC_00014672 [Lonchura striata domestica]
MLRLHRAAELCTNPTSGSVAACPICFQVPCKWRSEEVPCSFEHLKASTQYCVRTAAAGIARERSREAEQCLLTPAAPAGGSSLTNSAGTAAPQVLLTAQTRVEG